MRRAVLFLACLATFSAEAHFRRFRAASSSSAVAAPPPVYLPELAALAAASSDLTGHYLALAGTGVDSSSGGNYILTAQGSPTTTVAGSGTTLDPFITSQTLNGTSQYFKTAIPTVVSQTDFTACYHAKRTAGATAMMGIGSDESGGRTFLLLTGASGAGNQYIMAIFKGSGTTSILSQGTITSNRELVCMTYHYVSDGASVVHAYVNGVEVGSGGTNFTGPPNGIGNAITCGARRFTGSEAYWAGEYYGCIYTEKLVTTAHMLTWKTALGL